jgi:proto-oncogene tyrosine-protein kinase ROS
MYCRCLFIYCFFCRKGISNDSQNQSSRWKVVFNGSCSSICTWRSKNLKGTFQFRAVAANEIGLGEYSEISEDITLVEGMSTYLSVH